MEQTSYSESLRIYLEEMKQHYNDCSDNKRGEINDIVNIVHPYSLFYDSRKYSPFKQFSLLYCEDYFSLKELRLEPYLVFSTETRFGDWECFNDISSLKERDTDKNQDKCVCFLSVISADINVYSLNLLNIIFALFTRETEQCVIKISLIFWKPILEAVFLIHQLYEDVKFIKPDVSDWLQDTCYIVCKSFNQKKKLMNESIILNLKTQIEEMNSIIRIKDLTVPLSFIHQVEEFNVLTGKGILNKYNQINHLFKYKKHIEQQRIDEETSKNVCFKWCKDNGINVSTKEPCTWKRNTSTTSSSSSSSSFSSRFFVA